jgi:hypothetical protein
MRLAVMLLVGFVAVFPVVSERAFAQKQKKPASIAPAEPLKPGWEEIDKRLVFLMVRLANVEASLDAVEKRVGAGARQRAAKAGEAKRAEKGNEMMDRKGGGPVKWSQFYGRTAEKFFYHPVDRNTSYHTTTVLSQKSPQADNQSGEGVPSRQGLPVHQRPPQFDYIYKANQDAQARAERDAAQLRDKIDALQARRRQLEDEQSALWCQIAFRAVSRHDLARKPLYRFEPIPGAGDTESRQQAEATKAAAIFMRRALSIVEEAEKDQAKAFGSIKLVVADAHSKFDDGLLPLDTLAKDTTDLKTAIGRFSALARRLKDVADNLSDSYEVAVDGDRFKDELRKDTFRGLLQESLVDYAEVVLALNEMGQVLESEWKTKPDVNTPLKFVSLEVPERVVRRTRTTPAPTSQENTPTPLESVEQPESEPAAFVLLAFDNEDNIRRHWRPQDRWQIENGALKLFNSSAVALTDELKNTFDFCIFLRVKQEGGANNPHNRLLLTLYGEVITVPLADCRSVRILSDGKELETVINEDFQKASRLQIKSSSQATSPKLEIKVQSLASGEGWHPEVWFTHAELRNGSAELGQRNKSLPSVKQKRNAPIRVPTIAKVKPARGSLQTLAFDSEENIRKHWQVDGRWQIENNALKMMKDSSLSLTDDLNGDFELYLTFQVKQKGGAQNPHNRMLVSVFGEQVAVPLAGCWSVYLRCDGTAIEIVTNDRPQEARRLEIKSSNRSMPPKLEFKVQSLASNEEWHPELWLTKAQLRNSSMAMVR